MKYIRTFESYRGVKKKLASVNPEIFKQAINESVLQVGDLYKVRSMVDIPQSLINSYVKKEKDTTGRNLRQFFGDVEIAELLLQYITTAGLDLDKIPTGALTGQSQTQTQTQVQPGSQNTEEMPQAQTQQATQTTQETPQSTQETPQSTQEVPQSTQETPQSTQETPQNTQETQFEEPQVQPQTQEEEEEEDENEELPA
jgi:hypothetical protein